MAYNSYVFYYSKEYLQLSYLFRNLRLAIVFHFGGKLNCCTVLLIVDPVDVCILLTCCTPELVEKNNLVDRWLVHSLPMATSQISLRDTRSWLEKQIQWCFCFFWATIHEFSNKDWFCSVELFLLRPKQIESFLKLIISKMQVWTIYPKCK